mmetsp:Transcript_13143/g.18176  ORF Transcript_13143/g.18176 Transcript_13143/m.18176 type:complete len:147 (-) Transcript_13143:197-637(-)|eukprot:CAMPEP_0184493970 /NCGR_PEP_ID=MMETSP0113_2-20130426/27449_1 /TAXON_ID=91329 /ORGANISM="Norrisiella sphaerica, Strain BC52" /LENGTH=146 /DNA_ID=CAMNT_0026879487 /DNA_START=109 /DNA_END=549 /DNA_ORIENTATION=+
MSEEKQPKPALKKPEFTSIGELLPEQRNVNLICRVVEVKTVLDTTRNDGTKVKIAEATIADKTGSVILTCKTDEHFQTVTMDTPLIVRNGFIKMYKGFMRLGVDKWGLIEVYDDKWGYSQPPAKNEVNTEKNMSAVEYEPVPPDEE